MENNHILCLYVSYYLSRFNEEGYNNLGFGNMNETHQKVGEILETNPHTVKNMRDQFDPLHGHRVGWYQVPLSPSRVKVVQALQDLDEIQIRSIVIDILSGKIKAEPDEEDLLVNIASEESKSNSPHKFILRAPTGKAAEEYFQKHYSQSYKPVHGKLIDCRDLGVGYDFRIETETEKYFVEVKGLSDFAGGVLFTDKEWSSAKEYGEKYFLCIVSNLSEKAEIAFIQNPADKLNPKKNIYTSIQISWSVTQNQLAAIND
jgi:hypothetical protein